MTMMSTIADKNNYDGDDDEKHQGWAGQPHWVKSQQRRATSVSQNLYVKYSQNL